MSKKRLKFKAWCHVKDTTAEEDALAAREMVKQSAERPVSQMQQQMTNKCGEA